ncbi:MAG: hypothetical protein QOK28_111, partial [Actinomycetota bacterium]
MNLIRRRAPAVVFATTLAARLATAPRFATEWDSAQLALGVRHFDVRQDSPNAPGYWLFVMAGRVVRALSPFGAHASLVIVVASASAATATLLFLIGRRLGRDWLGWGAALLWLTSPFAWFYGSIVNVKVFDSLAIAAVLLCALRARRGGSQHIVAAVAV